MPTYDSKSATCRVFTYKEGLLSAVAHDLEIDVRRFEVVIDGNELRASFDTDGLRVLHAMSDGLPKPSALSDKDKAKIEANIVGEVLQAKLHPRIQFTAPLSGATTELNGTLSLCGRSRAIRVPFRAENGRRIAEVTLHQPDFGITPYSAMLGTLRIKPDVKVRIELPAE